jgi:hypothetical protein
MPLQTSDLFLVERAGVQYKMTSDQIATFVGAVKDLTATTYANMLAGTFAGGTVAKAGDRVFIANATGDTSVIAGWAIYRITSITPIVVVKIQEQESMDLVINAVTNLSVQRNASSVTILSDTGTDAVIPLATSVDAGLASPSMFNNEHVRAVAGLTTASNPINVNSTTQAVTFGISQLTVLP